MKTLVKITVVSDVTCTIDIPEKYRKTLTHAIDGSDTDLYDEAMIWIIENAPPIDGYVEDIDIIDIID